jgi:hypothetical protein
MPEARDKRHRTDLDLFILALIDSGVSTPHELQKMAGLSRGATIPRSISGDQSRCLMS